MHWRQDEVSYWYVVLLDGFVVDTSIEDTAENIKSTAPTKIILQHLFLLWILLKL